MQMIDKRGRFDVFYGDYIWRLQACARRYGRTSREAFGSMSQGGLSTFRYGSARRISSIHAFYRFSSVVVSRSLTHIRDFTGTIIARRVANGSSSEIIVEMKTNSGLRVTSRVHSR